MAHRRSKHTDARRRIGHGKRRRRGLGDLLTDRVRRKMDEHPTLGPKVMKRIKKEARHELCAEGHDSFCGGEHASRYADLEAAFAEGALAKRSVSAATRAGCSAPKGKVCVQKDVALLRNKHLRRGCSKRKKGGYVCTPKALADFEAGIYAGRSKKKRAKKAAKKSTKRSVKGAKWCAITKRGKTFNCSTSKAKAQAMARGKAGWKVKRSKVGKRKKR